MKKLMACLLCMALLVSCTFAEGLRDCHRVKLTWQDGEKNKARTTIWKIDTALDSVDEEINGLVKAWSDEMLPKLRPGQDYGNRNSRLNISIRYSRTGLSWMSFLVQAREVYHLQTMQVRTQTRTYDMLTGERITLADLFPEGGEGWKILADAVRETIHAYFPEEQADAEQVDAYVQPDSLKEIDFTLHGMSLVLHVPAPVFYPEQPGLIEVTLMYPDIRAYMTDEAQVQTDNNQYYKFVAFTMDDGPFGNSTDLALRNLMAGGARATFFLVGERLDDWVWVVQREHDEGHALAAHNWTHDDPSKVAKDMLQATRARFDEVLGRITGSWVNYGRPPGGAWEPMAANQVGLPMVLWSINPADARSPEGIDPGLFTRIVTHDLFDGGIILCHDSKELTAKAIPTMISNAKEAGYMFLTVDELFAADGVTLEPDKAYYRCTDGQVDHPGE